MTTLKVQLKLPEPLSSEYTGWFIISGLKRERASFLALDLISY